MKRRNSILPAGLAKKLCSGVVAAAMTLSMMNVPNVTAKADAQKTGIGVSLSNPRIVKDYTYQSGQKVTYDCVYFGSYPQAEVVASEADEITVDAPIRNGNDYIVDADLYAMLQSATGWDENGDVSIYGVKYRRIKSTDATDSYDGSFWTNYYYWGSKENKGYDEYGYATGDIDSDTYHYFKYQPIKWRVLQVDGGTALLLADMALDCQVYMDECSWKVSRLRSFINSYGPSYNQNSTDYSGAGFLKVAFASAERNAIENDTVVNDNIFGATGWNDTMLENTTDRIFFLSENEVYGDSSKVYGFVNDNNVYDEARRAKSSTYAKAMGCWASTYVDEASGISYAGNGGWWLRSEATFTSGIVYISDSGWGSYGNGANGADRVLGDYTYGIVRPALKFNLSFSNLLGDAGTYTTERTSTLAEHIHSYTAKVTQAATCTTEGAKTYTCTCGDSYTVAVAKNNSNHTRVVTDAAVSATCTKTGLTAGSHCLACGKTIVKQNVVAKTAHKVVTDKAVAATCTKTGLTAGSHCSVCKAVIKAQKTVAKTAHTKSGWTVTKKATAKAAGQKTIKCTKCSKTLKTAKIAKIKSVMLGKTTYTYDGKANKPTVTVKDSAGKTISASNYTVTYKNNKNVGKATVTVTFKGSYSGKATKTFTINRAKQTITTAKMKTYKASSLKKKAATVKLSAKTTGNGKLTYKVSKYPKNAKKYISVSKKGVVTLKKGAKKGIYKITITASQTGKYAKVTKTVIIKVK